MTSETALSAECSFPAGEGELPYYCEVHGHIRDRLTDSHCRIALAARSQPATEGLREALRARPKNGERIYVEEDDFVSGWGAAMDFIRAALAASEPDATGEGEKR